MIDGQKVRLAVDIGGTFTDVVLEIGAIRHSTKILTDIQRPERGLMLGVDRVLTDTGVEPEAVDLFVHGTTLATNALIERKGARTAFITTAGFEDILELGYEKRFDHYDLMIDMPPAIVPQDLRFGVDERLAADGSVLKALDMSGVENIADRINALGVEAVAIGFLHAYAHPDHELQAAEILRGCIDPAITICKSHEVCPQVREYERFSTTCANASVRPLISGYLTRLRDTLTDRGVRSPLFLMMSGGGLTTLDSAARFPIRLVESGPAGGAILAGHIAQSAGYDEVMSFDMGGTTAKICLISKGEPERARRFEIARAYRDIKGSGWPVRIPVIEMVEIGAGGGSIARVDPLNRITVGPDSAGSEPGPVCYGLGGRNATVTDANLVLGRIDPAYFAGGKIALDLSAADAALTDQIGKRLGLEAHWPAVGISEIVEENMANAARVHAIERGKDVSRCTMIAFGGGAPLHLCRLAEKLGISKMVVPSGAGVGSAIGFLRAPISYEVTRSSTMALDRFDAKRANQIIRQMEEEAIRIVEPAAMGGSVSVRRIVDIRYAGQGHEIQVTLGDGALAAGDGPKIHRVFEALYKSVYGLSLSGVPGEIITWSVTAECDLDDGDEAPQLKPSRADPHPRSARMLFDGATGDVLETPVYWRFDLSAGQQIDGPAIIAEDETSTVITSTFDATIQGDGSIVLERRETGS
ncbi:MAG: hydantoinase/oxoprolinase family protein [Hyphomicrobiales bacterium]|nr:hydantoinase/oxoprolinase family protein [Hyphomicrobiales bacterium]MCP5001842.1 hydantoinase/oxoprolinase family protein [Hyphomicrobiales bacterium]